MNLKEIKELIKIVNDTDVAELSLENEGFKLMIRKAVVSNVAFETPPVLRKPSELSPPPVVTEAPVALEEENLVTITAPMVGTFYQAPSPDAEPYVKVGDMIAVGQTLCIIEAMKLMNEIESEVKGRLRKVLVNNGDPVEFGQPLFLVEPA